MIRGFILFIAVVTSTLTGCGSLIVTQQSVDSLHDRTGFEWEKRETPQVVVHAEAGSTSAAQLDSIIDSGAAGKQQALDYLQVGSYEPTLTIFAADTRERMRDLIGRRTNATNFYSTNVVCIVWPRSGSSGLTHEIVHVLAMNEWGVPERSVNEGVAVDATGPWVGHHVHSVCKVLRERGQLPSLDLLTQQFETLPSAISYPAAGSFVRYLRTTHGWGIVRLIWNDGWNALPSATGQSMTELEAAWLATVDAASAIGVNYDPAAVTPTDDRQ